MKAPILLSVLFPAAVIAGEPAPISAINAFGVDLFHQVAKPEANALISPYSIETALAMTCAGADGVTREEMIRVLHLPKDEAEADRAFAQLRKDLEGIGNRSAEAAKKMEKYGKTDPVILTVANRLFGQSGYEFRPPFLQTVKDYYAAPLETMDFHHDASGATKHINDWVEEQTRKRISNLIPQGALGKDTRLVLVNAIYLKAPWMKPFSESATRPASFHLANGAIADVPTMTTGVSAGYAKKDGFTALTLSYRDADIQFLILLPDKVDGLAALEKDLTESTLSDCAKLPQQEVLISLPKFKLEPPTILLGTELRALGMKTAFDVPPRSANFDRMAPRRADEYLYISEVFHKTFLSLDEEGTEAAAATAVAMLGGAAPIQQRTEVHVDHPFLFAIQHRPTGACLFLGHVVDPR